MENDISSSQFPCICLNPYVRWTCLISLHLLVRCLISLFRKIYGEGLERLPLNGGALQCSFKYIVETWLASVAATLTVLSYMAG
jgi:hypothetical protein